MIKTIKKVDSGEGNLFKIREFVALHSRLLVLIAGSLSVSAWTMLRFFIKPTTFDLVGQQLLSRQWIAGIHSGATVGPTNYILKMLIVYTPLHWLPGSPRLQLILTTLVINIITFVLIVLILERLYKQFFPTVKKSFYLVCLWLSLIAGSMYWIQFSNSRNIEVAGGLYFIYLALKFSRKPSKKLFVFLSLYLSLLLFADPLQLYMSVTPVLLLEFIMYFTGKEKRQGFSGWVYLLLITILGFVGSWVLVTAVKRIWNVSFIALTTHTNGYSIVGATIHGIIPALKQVARLYTGGYEYGRYVEALNLALVVGTLIIGLWYTVKKLIPTKFVYFVLSFWLVDIGFYLASGQALQSQTSRYLIMTIPIFILLLAALLSIKTKIQTLMIFGVSLVILVDGSVLVKNLIKNWDLSFPRDSHLSSATDYLKTHHYSFAYASMDTTIPLDFYSSGTVKILPLSCNSSSLAPSYLFFDKGEFNKSVLTSESVIPLILDGQQISNFPSVCSLGNIESQLGIWQSVDTLSDGSSVLLFKSVQLNRSLGLEH